ncbi:cation diffusion facilitator family transporter [Duganella violaceipulchra]|uniref:Cation diffusion facilitator family transporter n=1 Tax=Duganella violaceipulchra TaxID=2849652 RepID=A0AA41HBX1_9BURK|nr:cation diffusion facilitator family transporter [Duganella violaceicalia]MBV6323746.1 cation diffusion facilitator family transporter [Duganella violaceicalia]MCP2007435.1 cation diffusion facilitator family transporter [Duganella violaceicalia]
MANCCEDKICEIDAMRERHGMVLWIVLVVNALMFCVEGVGGMVANSTSLLADSLDMLGDALVYGFSLFVLAKSARWHARAAAVKGGFMLVFGVAVLGEAGYKIVHPSMPTLVTMGAIGMIALAANLLCFVLLFSHRGDNLNMSSTWLCSRNDLMANIGVLLAVGGSYFLESHWPDIVVGLIIAGLFLSSAIDILKQAFVALREPDPVVPITKPVAIKLEQLKRVTSKSESGLK